MGPSVEFRKVVAMLAAWLSTAAAILVFLGGLLTGDDQAILRVIAPLLAGPQYTGLRRKVLPTDLTHRAVLRRRSESRSVARTEDEAQE